MPALWFDGGKADYAERMRALFRPATARVPLWQRLMFWRQR